MGRLGTTIRGAGISPRIGLLVYEAPIGGRGKAQIARIAELERTDGIVEAIDPVLFTIFAMVTHPFNEFCRNIAARKLHDALIQKPAVHQKFDVGKDLFLAGFGSGLAVDQKFGGGSRPRRGRDCH